MFGFKKISKVTGKFNVLSMLPIHFYDGEEGADGGSPAAVAVENQTRQRRHA